MLVLHHVPEPERALAEVARVLKPGGRVVVVDMLPHDRESYRQQMGHVWLGFSRRARAPHAVSDTGFEDVRIVALPPDAQARRDRGYSSQQDASDNHEDTRLTTDTSKVCFVRSCVRAFRDGGEDDGNC